MLHPVGTKILVMLISRTCMPITLSALEISWDRAESVVFAPVTGSQNVALKNVFWHL